jgi:ketosteroid isomerase-like protein
MPSERKVYSGGPKLHYLAVLLIASWISVPGVPAQKPQSFTSAEQEVVNVSIARRDAANARDMKTLGQFISDDCVFSSDDGVVLTKAQYLDHLAKLPSAYDHAVNARDFTVRLHGSTAILNFRTTAHEQFGDADIISEQRKTETWLKQNDNWQLIAYQWGNLPVNFRKPVAIDPKILQDYAGEYEPRPGDDVETLFVKDGKLMTQIIDDVEEYLPAGDDSFFLKEGDLATFTFSRDAKGAVVGYTYHRIDGQIIHVKKIK